MGVGAWCGWGGEHVDIVGAAEEVSQLSCVGDVRHLAFPSELVLSQWLSWGFETFSAAVVLSHRPSGRPPWCVVTAGVHFFNTDPSELVVCWVFLVVSTKEAAASWVSVGIHSMGCVDL